MGPLAPILAAFRFLMAFSDENSVVLTTEIVQSLILICLSVYLNLNIAALVYKMAGGRLLFIWA